MFGCTVKKPKRTSGSLKAILGCLVLSQRDDDVVRFPAQNQF
ncbi:hypothetical protein MtrunA17_Chr8g0382961 [Medicago truncatula]|uniref:Uncharacterized protein n=1 Tax=Medicago truncatula TaxID=3880 RepID=A0A396GPB8_MEDTR|nr:hypothetical protein MtrunA17_Chr8g0382961 [Medicago truncatula]